MVKVSAMIDVPPPTRILAIEPDPHRGAVLYGVLDKRVCADVVIVHGIDAALTSIAEQVPDLILTSTFLPPAILARLIDELRRLPEATHTQIITTPHSLDALDALHSEPPRDESDRVLRFPFQRTAAGRLHCDPALLTSEVSQYLEQARSLRAAARTRQGGVRPVSDRVLAARSPGPSQSSTGSAALMLPTAQDLRALKALRPPDRRRTARRRAADLAGQWGIRLSPDGDASIVDISSSGVRLETSIRLQPGALIDLELVGIEGSVEVGARLLRTETVDADGLDVKYRAAAMFLREIDLFAPNTNPFLVAAAGAASYTPRVLVDLLSRVLADAAWLSNGRKLWSIFEREVCALVRAKEARIRALPVTAAAGANSLYFRIPSAVGSEHVLHLVFDRGCRPTAAELRLLTAAASLASVVLDLAPPDQAPSID